MSNQNETKPSNEPKQAEKEQVANAKKQAAAERNAEAMKQAEETAAEQSKQDKATAEAAAAANPGPAKATPGKYMSTKYRQVDPYTHLVFLTSRPTDVHEVTSWVKSQVEAGVLKRVGDL